MANSSSIGRAKNLIARYLIQDDAIVQAIEPPKDMDAEDMIGKYIFTYHQNPLTLQDVDTFITIQVQIPQLGWHERAETRVFPQIVIWIISHQRHMKVDNIPKITANRNDYLSQLIDEKLNGNSNFGLGKLSMISNVEGAVQQEYLYRTITFQGTDINDSFCFDDE